MANSTGAFLVVMCDVNPSVEDEFNRWYDQVHLPEVVACPGFIDGIRGRAADSIQSPRYLAVYSMKDVTALETPELAAVRGWGPWAEHIPQAHRLVFNAYGERITSTTGPSTPDR